MRRAAILFLALLAALVRGQDGAECPTLEGRMCRPRWVFRGVLLESRAMVAAPPGGTLPSGKVTWPDGLDDYVLRVLRVDEAWKGSPGRIVTLVRKASPPDPRYAAWAARRASFVWFVDRPEDADGVPGWATLWLGTPADRNEERAMGDALPLFSMDLSVLRTPGDVRRAARAFAARARTDPPTKGYDIPPELAGRVGASASTYGTLLPLVPEIVPTAWALLETPLRFLNRSGASTVTRDPAILARNAALDAEEMRRIGADLLGHFQTPANVARLRALLTDRTVEPKDGKPVYPLRRLAYDLLTGWGVKVSAPAFSP